MKAMILAAGVGSRLDPLTRNVPKPLVPIVNRPVMEYLILLLKKHGFDEIMINTHYLGSKIEAYFGDRPPCFIAERFHDPKWELLRNLQSVFHMQAA